MMMNDFGTPMSDAEMSMAPPGAIKPHEQMMAESGLENNFWQAAAFVASTALGIYGANKAANAAEDQADAQNDAAKRRLEYDTDYWEAQKEKIISDREWDVEGNQVKSRNEQELANWKDATNADLYNRQLQIRNSEQNSLDTQYAKSEEIYAKQLGFNALSGINAVKSEERQLQEIHAESAFDMQKQRLEYLQAEGTMRARGVSGRSSGKSHQAIAANFGQQVAILNESLESAGRNTRAMIEEIKGDKFSADLAAYATKMLDPGELPMPIVPYATPVAEFQDPRALGEYDFGPKPVLGAMANPSAAASQVWGAAIPGIASNAANFAVNAWG
jgi:hypothetical protein